PPHIRLPSTVFRLRWSASSLVCSAAPCRSNRGAHVLLPKSGVCPWSVTCLYIQIVGSFGERRSRHSFPASPQRRAYRLPAASGRFLQHRPPQALHGLCVELAHPRLRNLEHVRDVLHGQVLHVVERHNQPLPLRQPLHGPCQVFVQLFLLEPTRE